ncbi:hypothetical protein QN375_16620 [Pseudomonas sp. MH9.2]|uniref:hypothetical protein n=1 Tax=unclassified Pseudomonas TaxID=196821 RepID=UPI002AC9CAB6|nr:MULTISPECIES: hypothetical protein [unclassified Pseudomonas]MEB0027382.1 hypothetical protein [Pseudomonas sp. MH9.2]MEB0148719.1 hypothetical protein [Pseudomonas sp. CCC2.2]MEE3506616.1 hypothetical protein [Pseudomonas sp. 10C3]WPX68812.1 hypothetical protein RHM55_24430 [Pseudomonas sp. MH9.2]
MTTQCPRCHSTAVITKDLARKVGALIGGLAGAATGCIAGAKLGEVIDERVLDNYTCLDCGLSFSDRHSA